MRRDRNRSHARPLRAVRPLAGLLAAATLTTALAAPTPAAARTGPTRASLAPRSSYDDVLAWGRNRYGQLGNGTAGTSTDPTAADSSVPVPAVLPAGVRITGLGVGGYLFSLALTSTGRVLGWGQNDVGQLGDGTDTDRHTPVEADLPAGVHVTAIASGNDHSVALTSAGQVYAWGYNYYGQLGDGTTTDSLTPIEVHLPGGAMATAIGAGTASSYAVTTTGQMYAWGYNNAGQLGTGTYSDSHLPVAVQLPDGVTVTKVAGGGGHALALTSAGHVLAWGSNSNGELGTGTVTGSRPYPAEVTLAGTTVTAVSTGVGSQSLALTSAGRVLAWGDNYYGQLGDGTRTTRGTPAEVHLPADITVTAISGGYDHSLALTSTGQVWSWGYNRYGQLGDGMSGTGAYNAAPEPVGMPGDTPVTAIGGGGYHSLAVAPVSLPESATELSAEPGEQEEGGPVTLTARVTCSEGTPAGEVSFQAGETELGTAALADGVATLTLTTLPAGEHTITAHYQGDEQCPSSQSAPETVTIVPAPTVSPTPAPTLTPVPTVSPSAPARPSPRRVARLVRVTG